MRKKQAKIIAAAVISAAISSLGAVGHAGADADVPEDHYAYNCATMGDHTCGVLAHQGVEAPPAHCWATDWFTNEYGYMVRAWYQGPREPHMPLDSASPCEEV